MISINNTNKTITIESKKKKIDLTSTQIILLGFLAAIVIGTILLMLPVATAEGEETSFLTALFTATTSVCVTGLVVVDTFSHWTLFGKVVILLLIQLGGLGIVTMAAIVMMVFNQKISLKNRLLLKDSFNLDTLKGLMTFVKKVVIGTFIVEGVGALFYMIQFIPEFGPVKGAWISVFTAISAFCNAGIDIIGPNSLMNYSTNILVNVVTMMLIILGGLGFVVWFDVISKANEIGIKKKNFANIFKRLNEHSKLVIYITLFFIFGGALLVFIFEYNNPDTIGNLPLGQKILVSLFQSVTFRTAGFASVPQENLTDSSFLLGLIWMFVGGSPVGTAGGVKTVTVVVLILNMHSYIKDREETVVFNRKISADFVNKAIAVVSVSFIITMVILILLIKTNDVSLKDAAFEVVSATATVGLSRSLTSSLNNTGRVLIVIAMYLGRVGPISMMFAFGNAKHNSKGIRHTDGRFIIG